MPTLQQDDQDTKYNPAQELYEREFGSTAAKKDTHVDAHGDTVQNNPNADIHDVKEKEEAGDSLFNNGDGIGRGSKLSGMFKGKGSRLKKFGPSGGVAGILILGVGAGSMLAIPASLLVMMERIFTNNGTHDVRANSMMAKGRLGGIFSTSADKNCATSKIKCKVSSMSKAEVKRWEKQPGVKIEKGRDFKGRTVVRAMTIEVPNGKNIRIENSTQFKNAMKNNAHFRSLNYRVQHPRATFFIGPDSKFRSILKKYKMSMGKTWSKVKPGSSKEARTKTFNSDVDKATGAETDGDSKARVKKKIEKVKTKVSDTHAKLKTSLAGKLSRAVGNPASATAIACTLYSMHKATLNTIKMSYYIDLIKFFHPFMKAAGQLINEGDVDPELMDYIGDRLTWYQPEETADTDDKKQKIDKTATDSQGFQAALYGDFGKLAEFTKHYAPWWAISAASTTGLLKTFEDSIGGKGNLHTACVTAKYVSYIGMLNAGGLAAYAGCKIVDAVASDFCSEKIQEGFQFIVDQGLKDVYEKMETFVLDSNLKGVDLGNAIAAGVGLFLMEKSRGSGLKPATTTAAVTTYLSQTNESYQQDLLAQKEDARANPFDTSNDYSLASNLAMAVSQYKPETTTGFSVMANFTSVLAKSLTSFGKNNTAQAGYFQPIESVDNPKSLQSMTKEGNADKTGRTCQDQDMNDIGVLCDWTGRSIDVVSSAPLAWAQKIEDGDLTPWNETVDYMSNNKYIDGDTGEPVEYSSYNKDPDPESYEEKHYNNEYLMYKAYCTNDRVYPLGTTMVPADDDSASFDNLGWYTGAKCAGNNAAGEHISAAFDTKLDRFFFYYNMCETQIGIADENQKCWEDEPAAGTATNASAEKNTGDWVIPTSGQCLSGYGQRWGTLHAGIDISPPQGTPIVAPTSMKIISAGDKGDGYGNSVVARATDGTNHMFRFGHMVSQPPVKPGQEVSKGTNIGNVGSTGDSTGPHLHFEIYDGSSPDGAYASNGKPLDPVPVLAKHGVTISCQQ